MMVLSSGLDGMALFTFWALSDEWTRPIVVTRTADASSRDVRRARMLNPVQISAIVKRTVLLYFLGD